MSVIATSRSLEDIIFRQVDVFQVLTRSHDFVGCHGDLSLVCEKILFKNPILRNAEQVRPLRELTILDNGIQTVRIDIFKLIGQDIATLSQLTQGIHIVIRRYDDFRHTRSWAIRRRIQRDDLVPHVDSRNSHHLPQLTATDDSDCFR